MAFKGLDPGLIELVREDHMAGLSNEAIAAKRGVSTGAVSKHCRDLPKVARAVKERPESSKLSASRIETESRVDERELLSEELPESVKEDIITKKEIKAQADVTDAEVRRMELEIKKKDIEQQYREKVLGSGRPSDNDPVQQANVMTGLAQAMSTMVGTLLQAVKPAGNDGISAEMQQLKAELAAEREARHAAELARYNDQVIRLEQKVEALGSNPVGKSEWDLMSEIIKGGINELSGGRHDIKEFVMETVRNPHWLKELHDEINLPQPPPLPPGYHGKDLFKQEVKPAGEPEITIPDNIEQQIISGGEVELWQTISPEVRKKIIEKLLGKGYRRTGQLSMTGSAVRDGADLYSLPTRPVDTRYTG